MRTFLFVRGNNKTCIFYLCNATISKTIAAQVKFIRLGPPLIEAVIMTRFDFHQFSRDSELRKEADFATWQKAEDLTDMNPPKDWSLLCRKKENNY